MQPQVEQQFISVRLPVAIVRQAEAQAEAEDRSRSSLIREAIRRHLDRDHQRVTA